MLVVMGIATVVTVVTIQVTHCENINNLPCFSSYVKPNIRATSTDRKTCITDKVVFTKYVMRLIFFVNILDRLLIQSICLGGQLPSAV